jgi:hypothetical protein
MGGVGSGNWYRYDKKTTAGETHSGLSSIKRYARMVPFIVNLGQGQPTSRDEGRCASLPGPTPSLQCKNPPMAHPG